MDNEIIGKTKEFAKAKLYGESTGHDWWHVYRVWKNAVSIGEKENADMFVVQLAAFLHDIADWKLHGGDHDAGPNEARKFLESLGVKGSVVSHVCEIIKSLSFVGGGKKEMPTLEGKVVQDADRLEALGAIGIARAFATGQKLGQPIHDPEIKHVDNPSVEEYKKAYTGERKNTTINHFYEKLLLLKDLMNTETAKKIAEERHRYMEEFLERFYNEWDGEC